MVIKMATLIVMMVVVMMMATIIMMRMITMTTVITLLLFSACPRLPKPRSFLDDLPALVKPGGVAVLISPYSWLAEYTNPSVRTLAVAVVKGGG